MPFKCMYRDLVPLSAFMQTLMNVRVMTPTTVMRMHSALTQWGVSPALATLVTLEMVSTVQVSCYLIDNTI